MAGLLAILVFSASAQASPASWPFTAAGIANRAAAREDAAALLAALPIPPGATQSTEMPPGTPPILKTVWRGSPTVVDDRSWLTAPGGPKALTKWMGQHPPPGVAFVSGGTAVSFETEEGASLVEFDWPQVPNVLTHRALVAAAVPGPSGTSLIRVDALVAWLLPRPSQERIPASARFLEVIEQGSSQSTALTISRPRVVRRLVDLINGFEIAQPEEKCPEIQHSRYLRLTFRARPGGPVLAKASQSLLKISSCRGLALHIGGKSFPPLAEGQSLYKALGPMLEKAALNR